MRDKAGSVRPSWRPDHRRGPQQKCSIPRKLASQNFAWDLSLLLATPRCSNRPLRRRTRPDYHPRGNGCRCLAAMTFDMDYVAPMPKLANEPSVDWLDRKKGC